MASSVASNEWMVVLDAPLTPKEPLPTNFLDYDDTDGFYNFQVIWGLEISHLDIKGELELELEVLIEKVDNDKDDQATFKCYNIDVTDKNGVLTKIRDSHGAGLYSIQVDIKFMGIWTISFPRLTWVEGEVDAICSEDLGLQPISWGFAMGLLTDRVKSADEATATIKLKCEGKEADEADGI